MGLIVICFAIVFGEITHFGKLQVTLIGFMTFMTIEILGLYTSIPYQSLQCSIVQCLFVVDIMWYLCHNVWKCMVMTISVYCWGAISKWTEVVFLLTNYSNRLVKNIYYSSSHTWSAHPYFTPIGCTVHVLSIKIGSSQ